MGVVFSVEDSDGQFLLIEAAHYIPKWLKPDTAINRVIIITVNYNIILTIDYRYIFIKEGYTL